jgi:hypothetical protein
MFYFEQGVRNLSGNSEFWRSDGDLGFPVSSGRVFGFGVSKLEMCKELCLEMGVLSELILNHSSGVDGINVIQMFIPMLLICLSSNHIKHSISTLSSVMPCRSDRFISISSSFIFPQQMESNQSLSFLIKFKQHSLHFNDHFCFLMLPHFMEITLLNKSDILCTFAFAFPFAFAFAPTAVQSSLSFRFRLPVPHYSLQSPRGDAVRDGRNFTQKDRKHWIELVIVCPQKSHRLMVCFEKLLTIVSSISR